MLRWLRRLVLLLLIAAIFVALGYLITSESRKRQQEAYHLQVTAVVQTSVAQALFDATRTAESGLSQYRLVKVASNEALIDIAEHYHTTVDVLRMANGLRSDVEYGNGGQLIVPEGVQFLSPPRRFQIHTASAGDTLDNLAKFYDVPIDLLRQDNPVLAERGLIPGDIVYVPVILTS